MKKHINHIRLSQEILQLVGPTKVRDIVSTARGDESLTGERLWTSLVYSGIALGSGETQIYFERLVSVSIALMRECITTLDRCLAVSDTGTITKELTDARKFFADHLKERARILTSMHADYAADALGIDPEALLSDTPVSAFDALVLQRMGHRAYRRNPAYFVGWGIAMRNGSISAMSCKCVSCMGSNIKQEVNELDELDRLAEHFGGMDAVFERYGVFLLIESRESLTREMEGTPEPHAQRDAIGAETLAKEVLDGLMGNLAKRASGGENPSNSRE